MEGETRSVRAQDSKHTGCFEDERKRCAILQDDMDTVKLEKNTNRRPEVGHPSPEPGKDTSERKKPGRGVWRDGRQSKSPDTKPRSGEETLHGPGEQAPRQDDARWS